jgi:hypothetical protein
VDAVYRRGVTDELHSQATKLSQMGYHVVVPELYRGKLGVEAEEAQHLMDNLDWPAAVADVRNAAKYLRHMCVVLPSPHPLCWTLSTVLYSFSLNGGCSAMDLRKGALKRSVC